MTTSPVAVTPAAPTRNREYGTYACVAASRAASLSSGQSIVVTLVSSHVPLGPAGPGACCRNAPNPRETRRSRSFLAEHPCPTEEKESGMTLFLPPSIKFPSESAARAGPGRGWQAGPGLRERGSPRARRRAPALPGLRSEEPATSDEGRQRQKGARSRASRPTEREPIKRVGPRGRGCRVASSTRTQTVRCAQEQGA